MLFEREIPIFLFKENYFTPFRPEIAGIITLFVCEKLFLPDTVVSGILRFEEIPLLVKRLQYFLNRLLVSRIRGLRPAVFLNSKFLPKRKEFGGDPLCKLQRLKAVFLRGLLDLLPMLINASQKESGSHESSMISRDNVGENFLVRVPDVRIAIRVIDGGCDEIFHKLVANNFAAPG